MMTANIVNSTPENLVLSALEQVIINHFQKEFPLCSKPYQAIADTLKNESIEISEQQVLTALQQLNAHGVLSRIGPVFDHKKAGASTLAALAVPPEQLDAIAQIVNQFEQVNHNYAREPYLKKQAYNLWFVATASDDIALQSVLNDIAELTGFSVLKLPMEKSYHIDLGFKINFKNSHQNPFSVPIIKTEQVMAKSSENTKILSVQQQQLLREHLEQGLEITSQPYQLLANKIAADEHQVIQQMITWQQTGLIRRYGLVVKHRKLGFNANAMVVWNIANEHVENIAAQLSVYEEVSLCYRRPRQLPHWPYNLFCMIHGTDHQVVHQQIEKINQQLVKNNADVWPQEQAIEQDILFSTKAYKQHGARYSKNPKASDTHLLKVRQTSVSENGQETNKQEYMHG